MKGTEKIGVRLIKVNDVNRFLKSCVDIGYVLHGSHVLCEALEPRPGYCLTGLKENLQVAVYATISPPIAIFNAIRYPRLGYARYELIHGNAYMEADQRVIESMGKGYVYVLDKSRFEQCQIEEGQFFSFERIKPLCVVKVTNCDLSYPVKLVDRSLVECGSILTSRRAESIMVYYYTMTQRSAMGR